MTSQIKDILAAMQFGAPRNNLNGHGRNVPLTVHNKDFHLTTPSCTAPFGISRRNNKDNTQSVSLALRPLQPDSNHMLFLSKLDQSILKWAHQNQEALFGTTGKKMEVIADRYHPCIKNKSADYP
eukprot:5805375-Prymnesium_polylepis.1